MRNRVIYANEGVFTGPAFKDGVTYAADIQLPNLTRLQSIDYDLSVSRDKVSTMGSKSSLSYKTNSQPSVSLNLNYYSSSFLNESLLGFNVTGYVEADYLLTKPFLGDILNTGNQDHYQKNFYLITAEEGVDFNGNQDPNLYESVLYYSDCYFQNYSYELNVGEFPSASVSYVGENVGFIQLPESVTTSQSADIPILNKKNRNVLSNKSVTIPLGRDESYVYTSDFSVGLDGWAAGGDSNGTLSHIFEYHDDAPSAIVTSAFGKSRPGSLHFRAHTSPGTHYIYRPNVFEAGKKYKVSGAIWIASTANNIDHVSAYTADTAIAEVSTPKNTWVRFSEEITIPDGTVPASQGLYFLTFTASPPGSQNYAGGGTASVYDDFYIADIVVTEIRKTLLPGMANVRVSTDSVLASGILDLQNDRVTSFNLSLGLEREEIPLLGHKIFHDRKIKYPIEGECSIKMIANDTQAGDFSAFIKEDERYNVAVTFKDGSEVLSIWDIRKVTFGGVSYSESIGSNRSEEISFGFDALNLSVSGKI